MIELTLPTCYSACNGKMISFYAPIGLNSTGESIVSINNTQYVLKDSSDNDYIIDRSGYVTIILDTESTPKKAIIVHDTKNCHQPRILLDHINLPAENWKLDLGNWSLFFAEYTQSIYSDSYGFSLSAGSSIDICPDNEMRSLMDSNGIKSFWLEVCEDSTREDPVYIKAHTIGTSSSKFTEDISVDIFVSC